MGKTLKALTDGVLNLLVALPEVLDNRARLAVQTRYLRNVETSRTAAQEEARAAWAALDALSGRIVWRGAVHEVTDPGMSAALAMTPGVDGRTAVTLAVVLPPE